MKDPDKKQGHTDDEIIPPKVGVDTPRSYASSGNYSSLVADELYFESERIRSQFRDLDLKPFTDSTSKLYDQSLLGTEYNTFKSKFEDWKSCEPASLRGHIVSAHFQARTLESLGVARHDIEIAKYRWINLSWVCKKAYEKLERTDEDILQEIQDHKCKPEFGVYNYREILVKNLKFIEQCRLATIDWDRVLRSFPDANSVILNIDNDTRDSSFKKTVVPLLNK